MLWAVPISMRKRRSRWTAAFTAKGKTVLPVGWKANLEQEQADKPLPELFEGMSFPVESAVVKEDKTTPPKRYTEAICCERGIRNRP